MQLQLLSYISLGVLFIVLTAKTIKYFLMPLHVRWELYPIPHEKGKEYGGSYLENIDWKNKPLEKSHFNQIKFLLIEIFFVKSLYHDNRKLWYVSYPFHLGLYTLIISMGLIILGAIAGSLGIRMQSSTLELINLAIMALCIFSFVIGSIGSIGLLMRRIFDSDLRVFSAFKDYFNLIFILAIFLTGLASIIATEDVMAVYQSYIQSMISFGDYKVASTPLMMHIVLLSAFGIYLPFTHMTHFIGKYFMWDKVRWDDEPNRVGSKMEAKINKLVLQKIDWSAPHLTAGNNWLENVTQLDKVTEEVKNED